MAHGKKISTDELFPHLDVLMEESPKGPRFGVRFWNWEEGPLLVRFFKNILLGPLIILFGMAWLWAVIADALGWIALPEGNAGTQTIFALGGVGVPLALVAAYYFHRPVRALYQIGVDPVEDDLVLYRKGRPKLRRKLSALAALSLGPHPDLPLEYEKNRTSKAGPKQKQHCLFAHFGPGGAERVMMVARWEWPPENSLFEVQQAVEWTLQLVHKMHELAAAPQGFEGRLLPPDDGGGRPPLD